MAKMGKEQRKPTAAELILAAQKRKAEEEKARQEAIEREEQLSRAEASEIAKNRALEMGRRNLLFKKIDEEYRLIDSLREINKKILKGKGYVNYSLPYNVDIPPIEIDVERIKGAGKDKIRGDNLYVPGELYYTGKDGRDFYGGASELQSEENEIMRIELRWDCPELRNRFGYPAIYLKVHQREVQATSGAGDEKFQANVVLSDPEFDRKFQSALASAFDKAHYFLDFKSLAKKPIRNFF